MSVTGVGYGAATGSRDDEALSAFEMISRTEARVRVYIGASLWITAVLLFFVKGHDWIPSGAWVIWATAGVVVHRMGSMSQ